MLGANQKIIQDEVMKKEAEYQNSAEILEISKLYEMNQVFVFLKMFRLTHDIDAKNLIFLIFKSKCNFRSDWY